MHKIDTMKKFATLLLLATFCLCAQQLFHIDFTKLTPEQKASLKLIGDSELLPEGARTTSNTKENHSIITITQPVNEIPDGFDGNMLRATWTFVPTKFGGWGNDFRIASAMVMEMTGTIPTLNAKYSSKKSLTPGKAYTMTCDFTKYIITSWTIDGVEQLEKPQKVWMNGGGKPNPALADFNDTNSETIWKSVALELVKHKNPKLLIQAGHEDYPPLKMDAKLDFLIGQANPMVKVFREAQDYQGTFSRQIKIAAAGRERESFQLVVFPLDKQLKNVKVTASDLHHADGESPDFPAKAIAIHPVGYIRTANHGRRQGWQWPDVLMPNKPFDVEPGFVQPVWFTVDVPHGAVPGDYMGVITVEADGLQPQSAALTLTVRSFSLPVRGKLKTAFCICPGMWEIWYKPDEVKKLLNMTDQTSHGVLYTSYECENVLPKEKWLEMYDFLLAHRLSPTVIYSGLKNGRARTVPAMEDMQYCYDRGMNATCLLNVNGVSQDPEKAKKDLEAIHNWLKGWEGFVKEKNWKDFTWYIHSYDETEMQTARRDYFDYAIPVTHSYIQKHFPWVKLETANPYYERHKDLFDIWTPLTNQINEKNIETYRKVQAGGQEVWAYVCCGPGKPYANFFIDFPGVAPRILPWQFFQYKITGFLYYLVNHYQPTENWNMNAPKWPDRPWNPLSYNTNSDGILIYPGPDATPLASTRLENLRDGIEDFEALEILKELVAKEIPKSEENDKLLKEANELLNVPQELSKNWKEYTKDPEVIVNARAKTDELIQKLQDISK